MGAAERIDRLQRVIGEARETPLVGGAILDTEDVYDQLDAIRVELAGAARPLPDGRVVVKGAAAREAIDELDDLLHAARRLPLSTRVRVDRERALTIVGRMRAGVHEERIADAPPPYDPAPGLRLLDRLDAAIGAAKAVPLTTQVRVERDEISAILDRMRTRVPPGVLPLIDRLDDVLDQALPVPLTPEVRVERQELSEIVQTMRAAFSQGTGAAPTN